MSIVPLFSLSHLPNRNNCLFLMSLNCRCLQLNKVYYWDKEIVLTLEVPRDVILLVTI